MFNGIEGVGEHEASSPASNRNERNGFVAFANSEHDGYDYDGDAGVV